MPLVRSSAIPAGTLGVTQSGPAKVEAAQHVPLGATEGVGEKECVGDGEGVGVGDGSGARHVVSAPARLHWPAGHGTIGVPLPFGQ